MCLQQIRIWRTFGSRAHLALTAGLDHLTAKLHHGVHTTQKALRTFVVNTSDLLFERIQDKWRWILPYQDEVNTLTEKTIQNYLFKYSRFQTDLTLYDNNTTDFLQSEILMNFFWWMSIKPNKISLNFVKFVICVLCMIYCV